MSYQRLLNDPEIIRMISTRTFRKGRVIYRQGEVAEGLHIINSGEVELSSIIPGYKAPVRHKRLKEGDFFGELSFIDHSTTLHTIQAKTHLKTYFIPNDVLVGLSHINPVKALMMIQPILTLLYGRMRHLIMKLRETNIMLPTQKNLHGIEKSTIRRIVNINNEPILSIHNLKKLPIFKFIHHEHADSIIKDFHYYRAKRYDVIFKEHEKNEAIYYVISGALMSFITIKRKTYKVSLVGPGQAIGLMDFFDRQEKITSCIAKENAILLKITREDFKNIATKCPIAGEKFAFRINCKVADAARAFYMDYLQAEAIHKLK